MPAPHVRFGLDSSYLIPLLADWHINHRRALNSYEHWLAQGARPVIPVHVLLECFSVLTRLPSPFRSLPENVNQALRQTFGRKAIIVGMGPQAGWGAIDMLSRLGLGGGRIYDAAIAQCAAEAGATVLLTWNTRDFLAVAPAGLDIREP